MISSSTQQALKMAGLALAGFALAPAIPAMMMAALSFAHGNPFEREGGAMLVYMFGIAASFVLGLPAFLLLTHIQLVRWWSAFMVGALISGGFAISIGYAGYFLIASAFSGGLGGVLFWALIVVAPKVNSRTIARPSLAG